jgi:hypothetical protein
MAVAKGSRKARSEKVTGAGRQFPSDACGRARLPAFCQLPMTSGSVSLLTRLRIEVQTA